MAKAKKKKLKLKVIFDTNVIYTGSASDLLRNEIIELINNHNSLTDIEIEWFIPETVIKERIFQMKKKGNDLLPSIQKLEKLLGHNLNITKEIIEERIHESIKKQLTLFNIEVIKIDIAKVDWESIIDNSLNRQIPFEDNEKEKGFRDALILESLKQLISNSPTTKSICRIVFITNDNILNKAANQIGSLTPNLNVFPNVDEFISLINILDSKITEELINKIINDSEKLFFEKEIENTLYYSQNVRKYISENFSSELNDKLEGANNRENGIWWIGKPGFEKKNRQQIIWKTIISVDFIDYKITWLNTTPLSFENQYLSNRPFLNIGQGNLSSKSTGTGMGISSREQMSPNKEKIGEGKIRFEVTWSVTLSTDNKLKNPKIDTIKYLDTITS